MKILPHENRRIDCGYENHFKENNSVRAKIAEQNHRERIDEPNKKYEEEMANQLDRRINNLRNEKYPQ